MEILTSVEFYRESPGKFDSRTLNSKTLNRWTGGTDTAQGDTVAAALHRTTTSEQHLTRAGKEKPEGGDDTVGNSHRAQHYKFELFELIILSKLDRRFPVEQFEATASQSPPS